MIWAATHERKARTVAMAASQGGIAAGAMNQPASATLPQIPKQWPGENPATHAEPEFILFPAVSHSKPGAHDSLPE
jgi:hypothetical protein